jgi:hypothetical protein
VPVESLIEIKYRVEHASPRPVRMGGKRTARSEKEPGVKPSMEEFIHRHNVLNYTKLLRAAPDLSRRTVLMALLAEEATKAEAAGWMQVLG